MTFLVDNQLPPALARFIEADLGYPASHVADVGLGETSDTEVWHFAAANSLTLI